MTNWPSRPASGEVLTPKTIDTVGSSTAIGGIGCWCSGSAMVSAMLMSSMPARQTMSPAAASAISTRFSPSKANSLVTLVSSAGPSTLSTAIGSPTLTRPRKIRPMAMRPR